VWVSDPEVAVTVTVEVPVGTGLVTVEPCFEPEHPPNARLTSRRDSSPPPMEMDLKIFLLLLNNGQRAARPKGRMAAASILLDSPLEDREMEYPPDPGAV
jgi:hypothetical protein